MGARPLRAYPESETDEHECSNRQSVEHDIEESPSEREAIEIPLRFSMIGSIRTSDCQSVVPSLLRV